METLAVQVILHPLHLTQMVLVLVMEMFHQLNQDAQLLFNHQVVVIH